MRLVYRPTPVSRFDVSGLERWLEDMALKGLYLKKFRPLFCSFARGEPGGARYRLEPQTRAMGDGPPRSMLELYREFGWDFVGEAGSSLLIFSTRDQDARELHTDSALQSELWSKLRGNARINFWFGALAYPLFLLAFLRIMLRSKTPIQFLVSNNIAVLLLWLLFELAQLPGNYLDWRRMERLTRQLKEGVPPDRSAASPRRNYRSLVRFMAACLLIVLLVAGTFLPTVWGGPMPLSQLQDFSPLSLSALEGAQGQPAAFFEGGGVDDGNFCCRYRSLPCPARWEVVQTGAVGEDGVQPRLELTWYNLLLPPLAVPLAGEQLEHALYGQDNRQCFFPGWVGPWQVTRYQRGDTDYLAVAVSGDRLHQAAAAARGGRAVVIRYTGRGDLSRHLEAIAGMVG